MEIRSDRVYRFPLAPDELWRMLVQVEDYPSWWPWVRGFDARVLAAGDIWRCTIQPPLPYALRCSLQLGTVVEPRLVEADVTGDLSGWARLELRQAAPARTAGPPGGRAAPARPRGVNGTRRPVAGTEVRVVTQLAAVSMPVRMVARAFPALARWGHDWVLDTAARQFAAVLGAGGPRLRRPRSGRPLARPVGDR